MRPRHFRALAAFASMGAFASMALLTADASAQAVPPTITHQGRLFDSSDKPISQTLSVTFTMYTAATSGSPLWTETHSVTFDDGYFSVALGSTAAFPASLFDGST